MGDRGRFIRDFVALLGSGGAGEVLMALVGLLLVRHLTTEDYARYVLAMTVVGLAGVVVRFGMNAILTREASRHPEQAAPLLTHAILFRLSCALLVYPLVYLVVRLWPAAGDPDLFLIAGLALFPTAFGETAIALLNGLDRIPSSATIKLTTRLLEAGFVVGALLVFRQPGPVLAAVVMANVAGALLGLHAIRPMIRPPTHFSRDLWRSLGLMALPLMLMGLASSVFQSLDIYVVSYFLGQTAVGQYGAALRILGLLLIIPTIWSVVALPRFSRVAEDRQATSTLLMDSWLTLGLGSLIVAALCVVLARPLTVWVLGARYLPAVGVLRVLAGSFALASLTAPLTTLLTAHNRQGRVAVAVALGGLLGLIANVLIGGRLGLTGVALVRNLALFFVLVACLWLSAGLVHSPLPTGTGHSGKPRFLGSVTRYLMQRSNANQEPE